MSEFNVGDRVRRLKDGFRGLTAGQEYVVREIDPNTMSIALEGIENGSIPEIGPGKIPGPYFFARAFELVTPRPKKRKWKTKGAPSNYIRHEALWVLNDLDLEVRVQVRKKEDS